MIGSQPLCRLSRIDMSHNILALKGMRDDLLNGCQGRIFVLPTKEIVINVERQFVGHNTVIKFVNI